MGTNTLETAYSNGQIIDASHINEVTASIVNQFVGRNTSGVPEAGKSLGTAAIPWGALHANSIILNGQAVDTSQITSAPNRVISGATRADSGQPQFLDPDGTVATLTLLGASTNLNLSINAQATTVSTDIVKTGLTLAPSANNTALVNDAGMSNDLYAGEDGTVITIDTVGAEIAAKIGQYIGLQTATGEIIYGFLKDATTITNAYRGYFFDDTGAPLVRGNLSDNDVLTLINIGWVFVEDNGTTVDITYLQPLYSFEAPSGPATGQYWYDMSNQVWKRYSGVEYEIIDRILVGTIGLDDTACIASRSLDFSNQFDDFNNVFVVKKSDEIVETREFSSRIDVYGIEVVQDLNKLSWNMTTDLESGLIETVSTQYYVYISDKGEAIISDNKPYERLDLKGFYHPHHIWRCIAKFYNDVSGNITEVHQVGKPVDGLVGTVLTMPTDYLPDDCITCDGASLNRAEFPELFNAIGTRYGTASGTTFNVPDYRGRFLRGWANGSSLDPDRASRSADAAGGVTGDNVGTVQSDQNASHTHQVYRGTYTSGAAGIISRGATGGSTGSEATSSSGGNEARPENIYVNFVIKYR